MTLSLIALSVGTTVLGVVAHVLWWRLKRPVDDALALAVVVGVAPCLLSAAASFWPPFAAATSGSMILRLAGLVGLAILHAVYALVYMGCYTAAQAASPSVLIVLSAAHTPNGVTKGQLEGLLTDELVCGNLIRAALDEKFLLQQPSGLYLGSRGRLLLGMGRAVRRMAGLSAPIG